MGAAELAILDELQRAARRTVMPRKRHKPEEIVANCQVDVLVAQDRSVADAVRSIGITEVTYYRWCQEFSGLKTDQVKHLKDLGTENARLRRAIAELTIARQVDPARGGPGKLLSPARRRACIEHVWHKLQVSECRARAALGQNRSTQRKIPRGRDNDERLTAAELIELGQRYCGYGYRKSPSCFVGQAGTSTISGSSGSGDAMGPRFRPSNRNAAGSGLRMDRPASIG